MYVVDSSARKATITLTGEEVAVKFPCTYSVFGIKGDSMLLYPKSGMAQGDDGVYDTAEGDGSAMMPLYYQTDTVYIKGTGSCVVWAGNSPLDCPFPKSGKGGGGSGGDGTHYKGTTTTAIENGSTTNPITIDGESYTAVFGDIVVYGYTEFVFDGTAWSEFGRPFDTTPTSGSANAVTSDGIYKRTPIARGTGQNAAYGGYLSSASGNTSFAYGHGVSATVYGVAAFGRYNITAEDDLFVVGNGVYNARSNILEVNSTSANVNGDIQRDGVGIDDYTTTERKIGKWIDGSDLYQRTFEVTGLVNKQWNNDILGTTGIEIKEYTGYIYWLYNSNTNVTASINCYRGSSEYCTAYIATDKDDLNVLPYMGETGMSIDKAIITIKYTKPSVQALNANLIPSDNPFNVSVVESSETPTSNEEPTDEMR